MFFYSNTNIQNIELYTLFRDSIEQRKSGTAQPYIYPEDIKEFYIPIIPSTTQLQISALVQRSFALKAESRSLLEQAKQMVEQEIEA